MPPTAKISLNIQRIWKKNKKNTEKANIMQPKKKKQEKKLKLFKHSELFFPTPILGTVKKEKKFKVWN